MITDRRVWKVFTVLLLLLLLFPFARRAEGQINDPNYNYNQIYVDEATWLNTPVTAPFLSVHVLGDDQHAEVDFTEPGLDFHFSFYGLPVEKVYISSNGYLTLKEEYADKNLNNNLESDDPPVNIIAPFWDDLNPGKKGKIYAWLDDNNPRRFFIRWDSISYYGGDPNTMNISFEAVLYEGTNQIVFNYRDVVFDTENNHNYGQSASIGLRSKQNGRVFSKQYSFDGQRLLSDNKALYYTVADNEPPVVADCRPAQDAKDVTSDQDIHTDADTPFIYFTLQDFGSGVDPDSVDVSIFWRGNDITDRDKIIIESLDDLSHVVSVSYFPPEGFSCSQVIEVKINAADKALPPNEPNKLENYSYVFTIESDPDAPPVDLNDRPFIDPNDCQPKRFDSNVPHTTDTISFIIQDHEPGIDINSILVRVEGVDVSDEIEKEQLVPNEFHKIKVSYHPSSAFSYGQEVNIAIDALDLKSIPNELFYVYSFTIESTSEDIALPYINKTNPLDIKPLDGAVNVPKDTPIMVCIFDDLYENESGVNPDSVVLKLAFDGTEMTVPPGDIIKTQLEPRNWRISYYPPADLFDYGQTVTVTAIADDYASKHLEESFSFTIKRNYTMSFWPYQWVNPPDPNSSLLTQITAKGIEEKEIGFDFMFYDQNISSIFVSQYGYISFEDDFLNHINTDLVKTGPLQPPKNIIAPFWDHLSPQTDPDAMQTKVYAWQDNSSPQRFIVQWNFIDHSHHFTDNGISFEVILNEDDTIEFYYKDIFFSCIGDDDYFYNDGYSFGQSATVGLRSVQNEVVLAQQYSHLGQQLLFDGMGLRFDPSGEQIIHLDGNAPVLIQESPANTENVVSDPNIQTDRNNPFIRFAIQDYESGVDPNTIRLYIQGRDVTRQITPIWDQEDPSDPASQMIKVGEFENTIIDGTDPHNIEVSYILPTPYSYGQIIFVRVIAADKADIPDYPNWMDETYYLLIGDQTPPYIIGRDPSAEGEADPNADITFSLIDNESGLDLNSLQLAIKVDGTDVTDLNAIKTEPDDPDEDIYLLKVIYDPIEPFQEGNITVEVQVNDNSDPPNVLEENYTFKVIGPEIEEKFYYSQEKDIYTSGWLSPPSGAHCFTGTSDPNMWEKQSDNFIWDDDFETIDLVEENFDFEFFGQKLNTLYISSNGYLAFEDDPNNPDDPPNATNYFNQNLTLAGAPKNIIAPYWDDLYPNPNIPTRIYWWKLNSPERLVILWKSIGHYFNHAADDSITFEAILYEKTADFHPNEIRFLYDDVVFASPSDGYSQGQSATIGIRSIQGDQVFSQQYSYNGQQFLYDKMILTFAGCGQQAPPIDDEPPEPNPTSVNFTPKPDKTDIFTTDPISIVIEDSQGINYQSVRVFVDEDGSDPNNYSYPLEDDVTYWLTFTDYFGEFVIIDYVPPNPFPYGQTITVYVIAADMAGNEMVYHYSFTTGIDATPPEIYSLSPERDEKDVPANTNIVFYLKDESGVDPNSIGVWINDSNSPIPSDDLDIQILQDNDIRVEYDPNQDFEEGETVKVSVEARDLASDPNNSNRMYDEYEFTIYSSYVFDPFPNQYKPTFHKYEWNERPEGLDPLQLADDDYGEVAKEDIGFPFFFFDIRVNKLLISSNGYITIDFENDRGDLWKNNDLNTMAEPIHLIAPFWDDLNPEECGEIYAWHENNTPQRFIIQWDSVCRYDLYGVPQDPTISFEVVIYENSDPTTEINNKIVFQYKDVFFNSVIDGYSFGQSASIGLRSSVGEQLVSRQYSYNGQFWLFDGMAISFDPAPVQTWPSDLDAPDVFNCSPEQYDPNVTADPDVHLDPNNPFIHFTIQDPNFASGVDMDTIRLYVQNQDVTHKVTVDPYDSNIVLYENTIMTPENGGKDIRVSHIPSTAFSRGQSVSVLTAAADLAVPPNWMTHVYYFTIEPDPNADITSPYLADQNPYPDEIQVSPSDSIVFFIRDEDEGVDQNRIQLKVQGVDVTDHSNTEITLEDDFHTIRVEYQPPYPFDFGEEVSVEVVAYDLAEIPNMMATEYTFTILTSEVFYYDADLSLRESIEVPPGTQKLFCRDEFIDSNQYEITFDDSYKKIILNDPNYADPNFNFSFFGIPVNYLYVSSNGYMTFDEDSAIMYVNNDLNTNDYPANIIAPYWDDLIPFANSDLNTVFADIYAWLDGDRYIIRWENMGHYSLSDDLNSFISFDVILYEGSNQIVFQYHDVEFSSLEDGYSYGQSASIGLRSIQEGQVFSQAYSYNLSSLYDDQNQKAREAISFMPTKEKPEFVVSPEVISWGPQDDPDVSIPLDPDIFVIIQDAEPAVDLNEVRLYVNGNDVTEQAPPFRDANRIEILYHPLENFSYSQTVTVSVEVMYGVDFPYWLSHAYSFTVMEEPPVIHEDVTAPELAWTNPTAGAWQVSPFTNIELYITDDKAGDSGVDPGSVSLWIDGSDVSDEMIITPDPSENRNIWVTYDPEGPFEYGQGVEVEVSAKDRDDNAMAECSYSFKVIPDYTCSDDLNDETEWLDLWLDPADPNEAWTGILRDDGYKEIDFTQNGIDFNFTFYGQQVETLAVSSNGYLTFGNDSPIMYINTCLDPNNSDYPDNIIAPYWDDLKPHTDPNSTMTGIYAWLDESSSPRRYIIQWDSIGHYELSEDPNASISFEIVLFEDINKILFLYKDVIFNPDEEVFFDPNGSGYSMGRSATVGIRSVQEGVCFAQQYSYNQAVLRNNLAVSFSLSELNIIGCLPAPSSKNISPDTNIEIEIYDPNSEIDLNTVRLYIEDVDVSDDIQTDIHRDLVSSNILLEYDPSIDFLYGQTVNVLVTANDKPYDFTFTITTSEDHTPPNIIPYDPECGDLVSRDTPIILHITDEGGAGINLEEGIVLRVEYANISGELPFEDYVYIGEGIYEVLYPPQAFPPAEIINIIVWVEDKASNEKVIEYSFTTLPEITTYSLAHPIMAMVYDDVRGKLWTGTAGDGLFEFDLLTGQWGGQYTDAQELNSNIITSMTLGHDGYLWIGTDQGLNRLNPNTSEVQTYSDDIINDLEIDNSSNLWVATQNSGVLKLINGVETAFIDSTNGLLENWVEEIAFDGIDTLWIGDGEGTIYKTFITDINPIEVDDLYFDEYDIASFFCDTDRNLWAGTLSLSEQGEERVGVYLYDQNGLLSSINIHDFPDLDSNGIIYAVHETESSNAFPFWFATDNGLKAASADLNEWLSLNSTDVGDQIVHCITEDGAGNLWLGTPAGLYKINLSN